ncbi:sulfurtransferase, partial [Streptomyces sp. URMC 123]|uniref:sulfurtransferase n=1 Tax=Streptomyces sp. URMC 123 TaxID=3423403 RepID=UPI003F1C1547
MDAKGVIISVAGLADELAGPRPPLLLDIRWQLGGPPGRPAYEAGHLPGAVYVDLDTELAGEPGPRGRHPLPDLDAFGAAMRRAGVSRERPVVVYDGGRGDPPVPSAGWAAARAWWLLRWAGHPAVRVLDGGLAAWTAAGGALSTAVEAPEPGDFVPAPGHLPLLDADAAAALARTGVLLDARAPERYRGEVEPIDPVAGHIPGALCAPATDNQGEDGLLLAPEALAERFAALGVRAPSGTGPGAVTGAGERVTGVTRAAGADRHEAAGAESGVGSLSL